MPTPNLYPMFLKASSGGGTAVFMPSEEVILEDNFDVILLEEDHTPDLDNIDVVLVDSIELDIVLDPDIEIEGE